MDGYINRWVWMDKWMVEQMDGTQSHSMHHPYLHHHTHHYYIIIVIIILLVIIIILLVIIILIIKSLS
jgi:hypothetical protein